MLHACSIRAPTPMVVLVLLAAGCGPLGPEGEEIRFRSGGDLVAMGTLVEVPESVDGDVMAGGREIRFTGQAGGAVLGLGAVQRFDGAVTGSLRAAGGGILVTGTTQGNATLLAAEVVVDSDAEIGLNAYLLGGRVEHRGSVGGHLRIAARDVVIDGPVAGDVDVIARSLSVGPSARIEGTLTYRAREGEATIDSAASIGGDVSGITVPEPSRAFWFLVGAARVAAFLLAGSLLLLLSPPLRRAAGHLDERALPALGLGLLWLVAIPVMAAAAFVTVIGIPAALIAAVLYLIGLYLAPVLPGLWLGRSLLDSPVAPPTPAVRAFLLGGSVVAVAMLLPWIGLPVRLLVIALGFGSVVLAVRAGLSAAADRG